LRIILVILVSSVLEAQWINYPTPGVPKNKDGTPNLTAAAPKIGGKPDLSGIWLAERNRPCPPVTGCTDMDIGQEFMDIGWSLKGGLPFQPWAAKARAERTARNGSDDPGSHCRPTGVVKMHTSPFFRRVLQTPDLLAILTERDAEFREIFLDGRPLPIDPQPAPMGYSTGRWEGDALVVHSAGFSDGWLDRSGTPLTSAAKLTERFRRLDFGHLDIELTVDDAKAYTRPWTITLHQHIAVNTDLLAYYCMENERDIGHLPK
jgi:hypothetical protein